MIVHNGVDLRRFDPVAVDRARARADLGLTDDDVALGVLAQITPWKGQDDAIAALARVRATHARTRLFLIGEVKFATRDTRHDNRAFETALVELADRLGVADAVHQLGERSDVPSLLGALDVVLVPSWLEPFGRSVIEAMAMERAVIATSVGGPSEIIEHEVTGLLAPPRDVDAWTGAVARLVTDRELRDSLGHRARAALAGRFDQATHVARIMDVYHGALAAR